MQNKKIFKTNAWYKLSDLIKLLLLPISGTNGPTLLKLIDHWSLIVNKPFDQNTIPFKIYPYKEGYMLVIASSHSTIASEFYFLKNLIIEKINLFLGKDIIKDIKVSQVDFKEIYQTLIVENELKPEEKIKAKELCQNYLEQDELGNTIFELACNFVKKHSK